MEDGRGRMEVREGEVVELRAEVGVELVTGEGEEERGMKREGERNGEADPGPAGEAEEK
jgi:hypothetical protein